MYDFFHHQELINSAILLDFPIQFTEH